MCSHQSVVSNSRHSPVSQLSKYSSCQSLRETTQQNVPAELGVIKVESFKNNSDIICVFCCKLTDVNHTVGHCDKNLQHFLTQLERYLGKKLDFSPELYERCSICANCEFLTSSFCEIYHEIKRLELKAKWKVENLACVIKQANRVSSRIKLAHQTFANEAGNYNQFMSTRKKLTKALLLEGLTGVKGTYPRVLLNKLKVQANHTSDKTETLTSDEINLNGTSLVPIKLETESKQEDGEGNHIIDSSLSDDLENSFHSEMEAFKPIVTAEDPTSNIFSVPEKNLHSADPDIQSDSYLSAKGESAEEKAFKCTHCSKAFHRKISLICHSSRMHNQHKPEKQSFFCKLCKKGFGKYSHYIRHVKTLSHLTRLRLSNPKRGQYKKNNISIELPVRENNHPITSSVSNDFPSGIRTRNVNVTRYFLRQKPKAKYQTSADNSSSETSDTSSDDEMPCISDNDSGKTAKQRKGTFKKIIRRKNNCSIKNLDAHQCQICNKILSSKKLLNHFKKYHDKSQVEPDKVLKCCEPNCSAYFTTKYSLYTHRRDVHSVSNASKNECIKCGKKFDNPALFSIHKRRFHPNKARDNKSYAALRLQSNEAAKNNAMSQDSETKGGPFSCDLPNCKNQDVFITLSELQSHQKLHGKFDCKFCDTSKCYATDLADHEQEHVPLTSREASQKLYKCSRCNENPLLYFRFQKHFVENHLGLQFYSHRCNICQNLYLNNRSLMEHTISAHSSVSMDSQSTFKCNICTAYFSKKFSLQLHMRQQHDSYANMQQCKYCGKSFKSIKYLHRHIRDVHLKKSIQNFCESSNEFAYACKIKNCGKMFKFLEELDWHVTYSTAPFHIRCPKNYNDFLLSNRIKLTCEKCRKQCIGKHGLKSHMKLHSEGRPTEFKCDLCEKVFKKKHVLQLHQEFHKDPKEWKFMCSVCSKKCATKGTLESHMQTHSKEKPFVCQICGVKYAHRHNLRNHVNTKHKDDGVQDIPKAVCRTNFVCRKGKKLGKGEFCLTYEQDQNKNSEQQK